MGCAVYHEQSTPAGRSRGAPGSVPPVPSAPGPLPARLTLLWEPCPAGDRYQANQSTGKPTPRDHDSQQNQVLLANGAGEFPLDTARLPTRRPRRTNAALGGHPAGKVRRGRGSEGLFSPKEGPWETVQAGASTGGSRGRAGAAPRRGAPGRQIACDIPQLG